MSKSVCVWLLGSVFFLTVVTAASVFAAVPQIISYEGYLTDLSHEPVNGTVSIVFGLYSTPTGTDAPLWTETQGSVAVTNGVYSVLLGSVTPIDLPFDAQYWLGVKVGADAEMAPRQALAGAPYARRAETVDTVPCIPGDFLYCYSGSPATLNVGTCKAGTRTCAAEATFGGCVGEVTPAAQDACNNTDGNCDGTVNGGCSCVIGQMLSCGVGACARSVSCTTGHETCTPGSPVTEICSNGIDDNCNGQVDEGCALPLGSACTVNSMCMSGNCVDGYCCNTSCAGTCQACNLAGSIGTCAPVPAGTDPQNECPAEAPCGFTGMCSGSSSCAYYSSGTTYAPASCSGSIYSFADMCNGLGGVNDGGSVSCAPYTCDPTICRTSCVQQSDCVAGYTCDVSGAFGPPNTCVLQ
jgi:hypothetical protein